MKFRNYLTELSLKKASFQVTMSTSAEFRAKISTEHGNFIYSAKRFLTEKNMSMDTTLLAKLGIDGKHEFLWELSFEDAMGRHYQVPTERGTALQVFAAVEEITRQFLKKYNPKIVTFTAEIGEASRVKLYSLLAKRIMRKGYELYEHVKYGFYIWVFYK
jgi:hypothetical protein